jgi:hypothetical protein
MKSLMLSGLGLILAYSPGSGFAREGRQQAPGRRGRDPVARVVTVSREGLERGTNDLLDRTMVRLDQAGSFHPDIACLPEMFSNRSPKPVPGPTTRRLAAWARAHSSYVILGLRTKKGNGIHNSAILLDRRARL